MYVHIRMYLGPLCVCVDACRLCTKHTYYIALYQVSTPHWEEDVDLRGHHNLQDSIQGFHPTMTTIKVFM